jgi:putative RNA 2'-phosphotransferase
MQSERLTTLSKQLSWLLRHGARAEGLAMDPAGWVAVADVLRHLALSRDDLTEVVARNTKSRLQLEGERLRACQGHSLAGVPVTLEALEASWDAHATTASLWHATEPDVVPLIAREGILPIERTHVHLAPSRESHVGKRGSAGVHLEVSPERLRARGLGVFRSPNGVLLVRRVPPDCVVGLVAVTSRARKAEGTMRAAFGW